MVVAVVVYVCVFRLLPLNTLSLASKQMQSLLISKRMTIKHYSNKIRG